MSAPHTMDMDGVSPYYSQKDMAANWEKINTFRTQKERLAGMMAETSAICRGLRRGSRRRGRHRHRIRPRSRHPVGSSLRFFCRSIRRTRHQRSETEGEGQARHTPSRLLQGCGSRLHDQLRPLHERCECISRNRNTALLLHLRRHREPAHKGLELTAPQRKGEHCPDRERNTRHKEPTTVH